MSTTNVYDVGDQLRLTATFTVDGVNLNPTLVVAKVKSPDGAITAPTATANGAGVYYIDVILTQPGDWFYRFEGTGAAVGAYEGNFRVRKSAF